MHIKDIRVVLRAPENRYRDPQFWVLVAIALFVASIALR